MEKKNEKDNNFISKESISNAYLESVKRHAEAIKKRIDVEHSILIYRSPSGCISPLYIIELKTSDPEKERHCFCFNEMDFTISEDKRNPYVIATMSPDILPNIPHWRDEMEVISYRSGGIIRSGSWAYAKACQQMACPEKGAFTAYKKVFCNDQRNYICELLIPEDAMRSSGFERKCRASKAKVVAIWDLEHVDKHRVMHFIKNRKRVAHSSYDNRFVYRVGETVTPTNGFDTDRFNTCAPGIHFFMTMAEAACY